MSTYNEELEWVEKSINSILNQTYPYLEFIIVLDNPQNLCLKNLLLKLRSKDKRISILINQENIGLVKSLNMALKHCNGTFIARMDADDISDCRRIEKQLEYLRNNHLDFIFSSMNYINEEGIHLYQTNQNDVSVKEVKKFMKITNISNHPTWLCNKNVYEKLKGYRNVPYCEDYDFSLRALAYGFRIGKLNENLLEYRIRDTGISRSNSLEQFLNAKGIAKLFKKGEILNDKKVKKLVDKSNVISTEERKKNFHLMNETFNSAILCLKSSKLLLGFVKLLRALFISKYGIQKYSIFFKYKSLEKLLGLKRIIRMREI